MLPALVYSQPQSSDEKIKTNEDPRKTHRSWTHQISNLQLFESWHDALKVWISDRIRLGFFQMMHMLCDFFLRTHRGLFVPDREGTDNYGITLKINLPGFVTGAERTHSHLYFRGSPGMLTGSYTTGKSCPSYLFRSYIVVAGILWKGGVSDDLLKASCVSRDEPFCDGWSYLSAWCDLEST